MGKKLSLLEVQSRIYNKNKITIIGDYINTKTKTQCKCEIGYNQNVNDMLNEHIKREKEIA